MRKVVLIALLLAGCSLAPKMDVPKTEFPSAFKEEGAAEAGAWKAAEPLAEADKGAWWKVFKDKRLDELQDRAQAANLDLKIAAARVVQARALAAQVDSGVLPGVGIGGNAVRTKPSGAVPGAPGNPYAVYNVTGVATYEPDLFNRVRDEYRARRMEEKAREAAYKNVMLALQADVAQRYFALRALDLERAAAGRAVRIRAEGARIMRGRLKAGEASAQDAARAETELASARADLAQLDRQRAGMEHGLAVLLGEMPSAFSFKEAPLSGAPPRIPAGLPSRLLERRPDVAEAFEDMAAANARIGAARAAYFPEISLTASGGFEAATLGNLFKWSSRTWAAGQVGGLLLSLPIFDNGRRGAAVEAARAQYDIALATYRQKILGAFRDVEDALADQRLLATAARQQDAAAAAAAEALNLARKRYEAGEADYFEVVDASRTALAAERAAAAVKGQRFIATVSLIRALGGGWEAEAARPKAKTGPEGAKKPVSKAKKPSKAPAKAPPKAPSKKAG